MTKNTKTRKTQRMQTSVFEQNCKKKKKWKYEGHSFRNSLYNDFSYKKAL